MKLYSLILIALLTVLPVRADKVTDNAHLLSATELARLEDNLSLLPVYIETHQSLSSSIESYANSRIRELTSDRAFLIVVTTHPRGWRISMNPVGIVSGESTRQIGDKMASSFKRGAFYEGLSGGARALSALLDTPPAPVVHRTTTTTETRRVASNVEESNSHTFLWFCIGVIVLVALIFGLMTLFDHLATQKARREQVDREREEARIRAQTLADQRYVLKTKSRTKKTTPLDTSATDPVAANRAWDRYTPDQRQSMVQNYYGSPYYHPGILHDPLQFYMFMMMVNAFDHHGYYCGHGSYAAAPAVETTRTTVEETRTESPSRSSDDGSSGSWGSSSGSSSNSSYDSSSSSSSYDSGSSSSFDSGGSSSDSGSGGSW